MNITGDTIQSSDSGKDQPVLVATDFSEDSKAALIWACKFAGRNHAPLILLHVVHDPVSSPASTARPKKIKCCPCKRWPNP
jgi:nucleotide-binding universal stress UspA family protein